MESLFLPLCLYFCPYLSSGLSASLCLSLPPLCLCLCLCLSVCLSSLSVSFPASSVFISLSLCPSFSASSVFLCLICLCLYRSSLFVCLSVCLSSLSLFLSLLLLSLFLCLCFFLSLCFLCFSLLPLSFSLPFLSLTFSFSPSRSSVLNMLHLLRFFPSSPLPPPSLPRHGLFLVKPESIISADPCKVSYERSYPLIRVEGWRRGRGEGADCLHAPTRLSIPTPSPRHNFQQRFYPPKKKKKKKSETELTASVLKKRSKTHKRLKERFLIRRNRTKRANFRGNPLFQATYM